MFVLAFGSVFVIAFLFVCYARGLACSICAPTGSTFRVLVFMRVFRRFFDVSDYAVAAYVLLLCRGCELLLWVDAA